MRPRTAVESLPLVLVLMLTLALSCELACTFYGEHPARAFSDATGGETLERLFWKDVAEEKWPEVERALASNYTGVTPAGTLDRSATIERYRQWHLKDFALGDLKTELNGTTIVVTYTITMNGTIDRTSNRTTNGMNENASAGSQLPSTPLHMMTVWQQQKAGWVAIAHSVSVGASAGVSE